MLNAEVLARREETTSDAEIFKDGCWVSFVPKVAVAEAVEVGIEEDDEEDEKDEE